MIISVIGGPDVGKSSLISRILINTGYIDEREVYKAQKESSIMKKPNQWLQNLVDTNSNEKESGITIQSSIESFTYEGREFSLVNNPGHTSLINEMIRYSSISDIGMVIISAKPNETLDSIRQGFEHALIIRVNGIKHLIICINKSEFINSTTNSYQTIVNEIKEFYKKLKFEKMIFCPVSAKLDLNVTKNDSNLVDYSLLDIIKNIKIPKRITQHIKPINGVANAKLIFHKIPKLISKGFSCVLYSLDKSYTVEFDDIKNDNFNFITIFNSKNKIISCILKINTNNHLDQNCLLRYSNMTIAYGVLY